MSAMGNPVTTAVEIPNSVRFWATYLTRLHGDVAPDFLAQVTGLSPEAARQARATLIARNVISPRGFYRSSLAPPKGPRTVNVRKFAEALTDTAPAPEPPDTQSIPE